MKKKFSEVLEIKNGKNQKSVEVINGAYPIYGSGGEMGRASNYICEAETIIIGRKGTINNPLFVNEPFWNVDTAFGLCANRKVLFPKYLYHFCKSFDFNTLSTTVTIPSLTKTNLLSIELPLPSLPEQQKIAAHLDSIQRAIDNKKQQLQQLDELVKSKFVEMFAEKDFPTKKWDDVFITKTGKLDSNAMVEGGMYPFFTCAKEIFAINDYAFDQEALLLAGNNAAGKYDVKYYKGKFNAYQRTYVLSLKENWSYRLFQFQLEDKLLYLKDQSKGINTKFLTLKILQTLSFIVPPNDLQDEFTAYVEKIDSAKSIIKTQLADLQELLDSKMDEYFGE